VVLLLVSESGGNLWAKWERVEEKDGEQRGPQVGSGGPKDEEAEEREMDR